MYVGSRALKCGWSSGSVCSGRMRSWSRSFSEGVAVGGLCGHGGIVIHVFCAIQGTRVLCKLVMQSACD